MIPVQQEILHTSSQNGDCLRACVASILELKLKDVPHFVDIPDWEEAFHSFLGKFDLEPLEIEIGYLADAQEKQQIPYIPSGYHIINGISPRGISHSVVGYKGNLAFDPHPDGTGLKKVESFLIFVKRMEAIPVEIPDHK